MSKVYYAELVFASKTVEEARDIMRVLVEAYRTKTNEKEIEHGLTTGIDSGVS